MFLGDLAAKVGGLDPVRKEFAEYMVTSTKRTFRMGGRPQKWKPSRRAEKAEGKTLINTARLMRSITGRVRGKTVIVGSNVIYGSAHQLGVNKNVTAHVRPHVRRTKSGGFAVVRAHTRRMRIRLPRRRFLAVLSEDRRWLNQRILKHLERR